MKQNQIKKSGLNGIDKMAIEILSESLCHKDTGRVEITHALYEAVCDMQKVPNKPLKTVTTIKKNGSNFCVTVYDHSDDSETIEFAKEVAY
jgi:hypothetical protein